MTKIRVSIGVLAALVIVWGSAAGCGSVSDQTKQEAKKKVEAKGQQVKQEVKKKVEAGKEDLKKKVDDVHKDVNDLEKKVDELLRKVDALEQQGQKK